MEIKITKTTSPKQKPDISKVSFGTAFSDHMFLMDYNRKDGWHDARIVPFGPLAINPGSVIMQYAEDVFEGMKAYRRADGGVQMFRPFENAHRMNNSAERMYLPQIPEEDFVQAVETLVRVDEDWVPSEAGASLYIRPFTFCNDPDLSLHTMDNAVFCIITCPVGPYYKSGLRPVNIKIEDTDVRAVRGGTGYAKCGGNYAAASRADFKAQREGYTSCLWLDGVERKYIEEVGSMNVMFKIDGEVYTPDVSRGSVLPGITRKSVLELLRSWGYKCNEKDLTYEEILQACREGRMEEAWGTGTAAVISPIGSLAYKDEKFAISGGNIGELSQKLYDNLTGIQWGKVADPFNWIYKID